MSENNNLGGGHYTCGECGRTVFGSVECDHGKYEELETVAKTKSLVELKPLKPKPMLYAWCFSLLQAKARECGYNLLIHGSLDRDGDFVAISWTLNPKPSVELINEFYKILRGIDMISFAGEEAAKLHWLYSIRQDGREHFAINLNRGGYVGESKEYEKDPEYYLDISVVNLNPIKIV